MKRLSELFEMGATGVPPRQGLTLEAFNRLFCLFLFHMFDDNGNEVLEMDEVQKAVVSAATPEPVERALHASARASPFSGFSSPSRVRWTESLPEWPPRDFLGISFVCPGASQEYLSGSERVSLQTAIRLIRGSTAAYSSDGIDYADGEGSVAVARPMDLAEFHQLYATMLGGVTLF